MTTVVTSFGPAGRELYGMKFLDTFAAFWPKEIRLVCYVEEPTIHPRAEMRDLMKVRKCAEFLARHKNNADAKGVTPGGYQYRKDAYRFCRKVFAIADIARETDGILMWVDADVRSFAAVPPDLGETLLGRADCAYLGREPRYSECGFLAFRLPAALPLIERWEGYYADDTVFSMKQTHDSWVFDIARRKSGVKSRDLTPGGQGHVWCESPLAKWLDHLKGARKHLGASPEMGARA